MGDKSGIEWTDAAHDANEMVALHRRIAEEWEPHLCIYCEDAEDMPFDRHDRAWFVIDVSEEATAGPLHKILWIPDYRDPINWRRLLIRLRNYITSLQQRNAGLKADNEKIQKAIVESSAKIERAEERIKDLKGQING